MITGDDLIGLGYKPDRWFAEALETINQWKNQGVDMSIDEGSIRYICDRLLPPPQLVPREQPTSYSLNLEANTPDEVRNMGMVIETMDELMKVPTIINGAVMPDACPTGKVGQIPVGGVAVAHMAIHPNMHSADICCSVMATNLGQIDPRHVMDVAMYATHFGYGGRTDDIYSLPFAIEREMAYNSFLRSDETIHKARTQLGTQGDGNHFLFVGKSQNDGDTFLITHHGSRGVGADLFKMGMATAERFRRKISPKTNKISAWIPFDTQEGREYWKALQIVRRWTKLNHEVIHDKIAEIVGSKDPFSFWNEHNFVFRDGDNFVHAKGATPLLDKYVLDGLRSSGVDSQGMPTCREGYRIIPLNMSEPILIVQGEYSETNLGFAPHGAGRNISRSEHKRRSNVSIEEQVKIETEGLDIRFFTGKPDISELPSAYKSAKQVQEQMDKFGLGTVVDKIIPYGSIMAGEQDKPWWLKNKKK